MKKTKHDHSYSPELEPTVTTKLEQTAYSVVHTEGGLYKVVKFRFDPETQVMGIVETLNEFSNQFDAGDDLVLVLEEDLYQ